MTSKIGFDQPKMVDLRPIYGNFKGNIIPCKWMQLVICYQQGSGVIKPNIIWGILLAIGI